jgi:tRNA (cytidine/uridine-2'-O-)-methyltransferase
VALSIVLIEPQIPPNTGNVARLCAATDSALHLIEPLGFTLDDELFFSSHGTRSYLDAPYAPNSVLVFGNETTGMPERIREKHADRTYRIPMTSAVRSLNLATAVAIVAYEAIRRLDLALDNGGPGP